MIGGEARACVVADVVAAQDLGPERLVPAEEGSFVQEAERAAS